MRSNLRPARLTTGLVVTAAGALAVALPARPGLAAEPAAGVHAADSPARRAGPAR